MSLPKMIRPPNPNDLNFIYSSWLNSYNDHNKFQPIKGPAYYGYHKLLINKLLNQSLVSVICNPDDTEQILGYAIYQIQNDSLILHWLYIKYSFRQLGLSKYLINSLLDNIKNKTFIITLKGSNYDLYKDKYDHTYNPKLAFSKENDV